MKDIFLSDEIDALRNKAEGSLWFAYERRSSEDWSKFWGCLDTLRDMDAAIHELMEIKRSPTRAECIGFLQILVSQQDAVYHLSCCAQLKWKPSDCEKLDTIRNLRNRISAHSAWSSRGKDGSSTSFINHGDIRVGGFQAIVYQDPPTSSQSSYVDIDFVSMTEENVRILKLRFVKILESMDSIENQFKTKLSALDWSFLDRKGHNYLFEKLWSPWENNRVNQAKSHVNMLLEHASSCKIFFSQNEIFELEIYELEAIIAGGHKLLELLSLPHDDEESKLVYYVIVKGWRGLWDEFNKCVDYFIDKHSLEVLP